LSIIGSKIILSLSKFCKKKYVNPLILEPSTPRILFIKKEKPMKKSQMDDLRWERSGVKLSRHFALVQPAGCGRRLYTVTIMILPGYSNGGR
jgi:hypothetical protein